MSSIADGYDCGWVSAAAVVSAAAAGINTVALDIHEIQSANMTGLGALCSTNIVLNLLHSGVMHHKSSTLSYWELLLTSRLMYDITRSDVTAGIPTSLPCCCDLHSGAIYKYTLFSSYSMPQDLSHL